MPEYLAPGVYVEEQPTGSAPIEGVSTSTAGMLGVTERGPVNYPILITSYGEYTRWFGERLRKADFSNTSGAHSYLPHGVEGFFVNGGKRVYVTRVLADGATPASTFLFDRGDSSSANTLLLRAAGELTGTAAHLPVLYVLDPTHLSKDFWVRIGDGSSAEYRKLAADPDTINTTHVALDFPLSRSHDAGVTVQQFKYIADPNPFSLTPADNMPTKKGDQTILITGDTTALNNLKGRLLEIGAPHMGEYRFAIDVTNVQATQVANQSQGTVHLDSGLLMSHAPNVTVTPLQMPPSIANANLGLTVIAGDRLIFLDNRQGLFDTRNDLVVIDSGNTLLQEVRRIGELSQLELTTNSYRDYPAGSIVEVITLADDFRTVADPNPQVGDTSILVDDVTSLTVDQKIQVGTGAAQETLVIQSITPISGKKGRITFTLPAKNNHAVGDPVTPGPGHITLDDHPTPQAGDSGLTVDDVTLLAVGQKVRVGTAAAQESLVIRSITPISSKRGRIAFTTPLTNNHAIGEHVFLAAKHLSADVSAGTNLIALDDRLGLSENDVLRIDEGPREEFVTIKTILNRTSGGVAPDAGNVVLTQPLNQNHAKSTRVWREGVPTVGNLQPTTTVLDAPLGVSQLLVTDGTGYGPSPNNRIRLTTPTNEFFYHELAASAVTSQPALLTLDNVLEHAHEGGSVVVSRNPLIQIQALDAGAWGNRLRLSIEDEPTGLVSKTTIATITNPTHIRLASAAGVEAGTILELLDPLNNDAVVGDPLKVQFIDRASNFTIVLQGAGLSAAQQAAQTSASAQGKSLGVRSREFRLTIQLLRQPDPALPSRNDTVQTTEVFRYLSMDSRHSRYVQTIIGDISGPIRLSDGRPEGESWYVRVHDLAQDLTEPGRTNALESIRLGPEALVDILPTGRERPARQALEDGIDSIETLKDDTYIGNDDPEPAKRTGLFTFTTVDEISLLACPGRTSASIQGALIDQCELLRYRFAVLDGPPPPDDSLSDVQTQRQQFDTKYAALYHPWLLIPDPFPPSLANIANYPIPPSGHVLGVYARTDIDRGVHKAPANEVVRGILGLQRMLNKSEQDTLNPSPGNINVIRDFRHNDRGLRVFGARVITSDTDWKYVNVRRLLIFIEASIDRGLQWVVFEPNAEPLWARVRRTIVNFLTVVWRNGALEGTKPEEAFFVKCDRTTMTQTDIDNGRLICVIGVAPVKPAEFVIIRIGLFTTHADT